MVDFLFALIERFFAIYYRSGVMRRNVYISAVLHGRAPSTILDTRKQETLGYPMAKTAFLCVP